MIGHLLVVVVLENRRLVTINLEVKLEIKVKILKLIKAFGKVFGLRELLMVSGLLIFGYGLYLFRPWISFTVCGLLLIVGGFFSSPGE